MRSFSNRRMAPLSLASIALLSARFVVPAQAQTGANPLAIRTQKRVATLFQTAGRGVESLNLSAAQQAKLKSIAQKNAPLAKAIWSDASLSPTQKMRKMRALQNEASAVFTPVQKQKIASAKNGAMMQLFQTAAWVSNELQLTGTQQEQIQGIVMRNYRQGQNAAGSLGMLRGLLLDTDNQIAATLTPTQRTKWNVIKGAARSEFVKNARALRAMSRV